MKNSMMHCRAGLVGAVLALSLAASLPAVAAGEACMEQGHTQRVSGSTDGFVAGEASPPVQITGDLTGRLRHTKALGLGAKFKLKRQLTRLFDSFSSFHEGAKGISQEQLRGQFDSVLTNLLMPLRKGDSELHRDLLTCKEDIWLWLSDVRTFADIKSSI